jgi:hypothetical protein
MVNGSMGLPVTVVPSGGIPVVDAISGLPVTQTSNGLAVTVVSSFGLPVSGLVLGPPTGIISALEARDTALIIGTLPDAGITDDDWAGWLAVA